MLHETAVQFLITWTPTQYDLWWRHIGDCTELWVIVWNMVARVLRLAGQDLLHLCGAFTGIGLVQGSMQLLLQGFKHQHIAQYLD